MAEQHDQHGVEETMTKAETPSRGEVKVMESDVDPSPEVSKNRQSLSDLFTIVRLFLHLSIFGLRELG